jgi:glutaconate CoA-transferase subunit A
MSKTAPQTPQTVSVTALAERIADGTRLALAPDYSGCAMRVVRELMRRPVRDLHIVAVPQGGFQVDMLVGAGCVARIEAAAVTLGEHGIAPRFSAAIRAGTIEMWDATCPAIHAGLQAAEKGIPFMPLRGILGSDLTRVRPDWKVIDNPLRDSGTHDPIVILPAIRPDIALFHAAKADRSGNVWIGVRRELMLMAHASATTLVTVESIEDTDFLADPALAAGTIPALYITGLAVAPSGASPIGLAGHYPADSEALRDYAKSAATDDGFARWVRVYCSDLVPA